MPSLSYYSGRYRRLLRFQQWQLSAALALGGVQFALAPGINWINLVGFVVVGGFGWFWLIAMRHYLLQLNDVGVGPRQGWEKVFRTQLIVGWVLTLACLMLSDSLLSGLPLLTIASAPAYLLGYALVGNLFYALTGLASVVTLGFVGFGPTAEAAGWLQVKPGLSLFARLAPTIVLGWQLGKLSLALHRFNEHQVDSLQSKATTDGLTGLMNRRQLDSRLAAEIARTRRHQKALSLALFDIDNFKHINDYYGHPVGDRILQELGALLKANIRECDIAARYGGEEFALILPETRRLEAYELLERLRRLVEQHVFCLPDAPLSITVSVGVTQFDYHAHTQTEFVDESDKALYEAKALGKNRVVIFGMGKTKPSLLNITQPESLGA